MPLSNFTNLDFDQIKTNLIDYLRSNSNFTDYDFEGSNLSSILDVLAYNTYITSYNANMVSNEVFIDSATLRENVVALAKNIGYVPRSRKSSEANISFFVDTTINNINNITPASITLKKGPVAASLGSFGNTSFVFSILEDITRPVFDNIATFDEIPIYEGNLITTTFTVSSFNPNQRFILPNSGIDTRLINVYVTEVEDRGQTRKKYQLKEDLFDLDSESRVYFIQEIDDERYEIIFPDGIFGRKLKTDDVIDIEYIVCNGESANGINQFVFNGRLITTRNGVDTNYPSGISLITTNLASSGGDVIESVESIKKYAPRVYSSYNRALTASDYQALIPSRIYPETESITVFGGEDLSPPQYGKVFISIKPKNGDFIPNLIKENIKNKLKRYAVAGIVPEILDLKYLYIEVNSKVYYNTNLENSSSLSNLIISNVQKYSESTELNRYGAKFKYSKFLGIIDNSDESVTSNISTIQIRRDLRVVLNTFTEYKIGFGNEFHVKSNRFNIKTSAFRVSGINSDLYFSDFTSNIESETGSIFIFSLPSQTSKDYSIVRENVGTINYKTGEIVLNPLNISSAKNKDGTAIIEISAIPKSNDVIGKQDLYLQLDISKSTFEMVQDSIVSGFDFSAANYTVSSSYTNGNLVRP
jgi:hypothetical protein